MQYDIDVINQIKRIWLKKYNKDWLINVDSYDIDDEKNMWTQMDKDFD
jgi:hypothetical protein